MLEIAIPFRGDVKCIIPLVKRALSYDFVGSIHVAINPQSTNIQYLDSFLDNKKVRISIHNSNIGLYGNFRFLVNHSNCEFFMFWCYDDRVTADLRNYLRFAQKSQAGLCVGSFQTMNFEADTLKHTGVPIPVELPDVDSHESLLLNALVADPSWIFGIWKASYLKRVFPRFDYDWLDASILIKAGVDQEIVFYLLEHPNTIGTFPSNKKTPHSVKPGGHRARHAILYQLLFFRFYFFNRRLARPFLRRILNLFFVARHYRKLHRIGGGSI